MPGRYLRGTQGWQRPTTRRPPLPTLRLLLNLTRARRVAARRTGTRPGTGRCRRGAARGHARQAHQNRCGAGRPPRCRRPPGRGGGRRVRICGSRPSCVVHLAHVLISSKIGHWDVSTARAATAAQREPLTRCYLDRWHSWGEASLRFGPVACPAQRNAPTAAGNRRLALVKEGGDRS